MSILQNSNAISAGGYDINNSLRTRRSANAYLSRTPASAGNRKTWTWSAWVKKAGMGVEQVLFNCQSGNASALRSHVVFNTTDTLEFRHTTSGGSTTTQLITTQVFRDPSAWYHIMIVSDTTQATSSDRIKFYINGSQVTAFGTATYPSLNYDGGINQALGHRYASDNNGTTSFDGYTADMYFIDGTALTPSSFGETDTTTGVWKPKAYTGSYGTNGFYLNFSDIATTSGSNAGLGKDFSGNSNYWTTNNISVTSGTTYDAMTDSPTLTSATVANYCTLNPVWLLSGSAPSITNGNLQVTSTSTGDSTIGGTIGMTGSGKYYAEFTAGTASIYGDVGIINITHPASTAIGNTATSYNYRSNGNKTNNSTQTAYGATYTTNDVIGVAFDLDNGTITFYKNNVSQGTAFTGISASNTYTFACGDELSSGTFIWTANFGQRPFAYTPPTGYKALNTFNLPDSTIKKGNSYMDATLYTGTGSALTVTNAASFQPDFVWLKSRSAAQNHNVFDSNRGTTKRLNPNLADFEDTASGVTSFNSNGFTLGTNSVTNTNTNTYVAWQWQAGQGTTSSNTSGNITSTVDVSTTAGCSIITYTGNGTSTQTVGHGLGVAPKFIIVKARSSGATMQGWFVWHTSLTSGYNLRLELTDAQFALSGTSNGGIGSSPSSTTFTLANGSSTNSNVNQSSQTYVAYCWAEIAGFSKFGSYTGNGSADGPFVYTGFRPKYVMFKRTDAVSNWQIQDSVRNPYNATDARLYANLSDAEAATSSVLDLCSNGFKIRVAGTDNNTNGGTYIYAAFAENPFKNSLAR